MAGCNCAILEPGAYMESMPGKQKNKVVHKTILSFSFSRIRVYVNSATPNKKIKITLNTGLNNSSAIKYAAIKINEGYNCLNARAIS